MTLTQLLSALREHKVVLRLEGDKLRCELPEAGIPADLRADLVARSGELKSYLADMAKASQQVKIPVRPVEVDRIALSSAQRRLWLLDQLDGSSAHTNMAFALALRGRLDEVALEAAFAGLLERHQSLRTRFAVDEQGEPFQQIQPATGFRLLRADISHLSTAEQEIALAEARRAEVARHFDLGRDLLLAARLLKLGEDEHQLLITIHHIASDGWSMAILVREFCAFYGGQASLLPPLDIQYADYAHWQQTTQLPELMNTQLPYWKTQLADLPLVHNLPLDYPRPRVQGLNGARHLTRLDASRVRALTSFSQAEGATLFMGLQAIFALLLARYSNHDDIVMGTLIANREEPQVAPLIGCFFNALVLRNQFGKLLRNQIADEQGFRQLLAQSRRLLLDAYQHQQLPFEQLVESLAPERSPSYSPLFQVLLIMQNTEQVTLELPGLTLEVLPQERNQVAYDLRLEIIPAGDALELHWEYRTDLFKAETVARLAGHYQQLLDAALAAPDESVWSLNLLTDAEREQQLSVWSKPVNLVDEAGELCVHQRFEAQVMRTPEQTALIWRDQSLSYAALNARANQLAHYLRHQHQVGPDKRVGICLTPSPELIISILAILKAGGAYVPLDAGYPQARLEQLLEDADLSALLTRGDLLAAGLPGAICLDTEPFADQPETNLGLASEPGHLAYVIFTSGSTGRPKGVQVERRGLRNLLRWYLQAYEFSSTDRFYILSSPSFDLTQKNLFAPLLLGGQLVLAGATGFDPLAALGEIRKLGITQLNCAPSMVYPLIENSAETDYASLVSLRYLLLGGEPINGAVLAPWQASANFSARIINMYGPTECTDIATENLYREGEGAIIGKPIDQVALLVLNRARQLVPAQAAGELCIGGAGVARGYLNQPVLTAEKFIPNPFAAETGCPRLYRTGDLVRWLPDGRLEFLGRVDQQVKIRGLRIEPGEIEQVLLGHPAVKEALVLASEQRLLAYVVSADPAEQLPAALRAHLQASLPDYMIPAAFVVLERFPLTPNGKLDRKALPAPDTAQNATAYVAPANELEAALCAIWQELLGVERVGTGDDFFKLGGHSLLAIRMLTRVRQQLGVAVALNGVFGEPTVAGLARVVETLQLHESNRRQLAEAELADVELEEGFI